MDAETLKRIENFLAEHDHTIDTISKARLMQFEKTDNAIQTRLAKIESAKNILKDCSINVSVIAVDSGISRKTFYNNDLLRLYVEKYACDPEEDSTSAEIHRLKTRTDQYKEQVEAFLLRDIETENLRHENKKLTFEISNLQKQNKNLEEQYASLLKEIKKTQSKPNDQRGHITQFPSSR